MIYYPIDRRYGGELHDIREFIQKDSYTVLEIIQSMDFSDKQNFIQSCWNWVVKYINYPYFTADIAEIFDRHYEERYIKPPTTSVFLRNVFITGALSGLARNVFNGVGSLSTVAIMKDVLIANGLYSLVQAVINKNGNILQPQFKNEQNDFWNFPSETIRDGMGDCEDTSILLCSMLRHIINENEVFVTVGLFEGTGHAWVTIFNDKGTPIALETTGDNILQVNESTIEQYPYVPYIRFNDKQVIIIKDIERVGKEGVSKRNEYKKIKALNNFYVLKKINV